MKKFVKLAMFILMAAMALVLFSCEQEPNVPSGDNTNPSGGTTTTTPAGFVAVTGATVSGAVGSGDTASSIFIEGRSVTIPNLLVCDHEVTQAEYESTMGSNPSESQGESHPPAEGETQANRPVERVSWYAVLVYCNKRSIAENLTPCYTINSSTNPADWGTVPTSNNTTWNEATCNFNANGYRLPTQAEWEYVARGGNNGIPATQTTYSGSNTVGDVAWYLSNSGDNGTTTNPKTHEVKKKNANTLGVYDMNGNVKEWCWDWYGSISSTTEATGATSGTHRVNRGGSYIDVDICSTVSLQGSMQPYYNAGVIGFRVVRTAQ